MEVFQRAKFDSFAEFDQKFRDFQVTTNTRFLTKASRTADVVNCRRSGGLARLDANLKFGNVTYACKHGGTARKTETGIRPHQRYAHRACRALVNLPRCPDAAREILV
ncbi:hypothetical protein HPB48_000172 [Haemaphysalis longicornis]|uniref:ZSWIM3 N-terminal domain-containing protein n=1 Tax=Haemaphysalis longicornis TaxID=44386 RepID=A0A9J6GH05_HAELO|nr:hypothetical protein HPB48_000172 [Haemaphysalis longicornis]